MHKDNSNASIKSAVFINAVGKYSSVFFQLIFSAFLSRILTPAEFGVVTVINVFVVFFELFSDLGIGTAIIQKRTLTETDIECIFGFTVYLGMGLALLFCILAYGIAHYLGNNVYITLGQIFAVSIMLASCNTVPNALLMKNKQFIAVSIRNVVACIVSYAVAILLALYGFSYYSLVIRSVVMSAVLFLWNRRASRIRLCLKINRNSIQKIWDYSLFQFGASIINYFQRNLDNLLVGKYMGEEQVGYYNKSYTLMQYPILYLPQVITPVLHPIMAEHQNDKNYIYDQYIKIVQFLSSVGCFICVFFFFASEEIIMIMFGNQWKAAVEPFGIISLSIWPQMLTSTVGCIMQSLDDTKNLFRMCMISLIVSTAGVTIGVASGDLNNLAICIVVIYYLHFIIYYYYLMHIVLKKSFWHFFKMLQADIASLFFMFAAGLIITKVMTTENLFLSFFVKGILFIGIYVLILILTKRYKLFLHLLYKKKLK